SRGAHEYASSFKRRLHKGTTSGRSSFAWNAPAVRSVAYVKPGPCRPLLRGLARVPRRPRRARLTAESGPAAHAAPGAAAEPEDGPRQDSGGRRTKEGSFRMPGEAAPHRAHTVIDSPLGPLTLVAADGELVALHMDRWRHRPIDEEYGEPDPRPFQTAITQLGEYFDGRR